MSSAIRVFTAALLVALIVTVVSGCRRRKPGKAIERIPDDIFTTDNFPGAPVQDGNLAQDRRALSPDRESVAFSDCVTNGDRGTAMLTWLSFSDGGVPPIHLYASYYDGAAWTPPVHLAAPDAVSGGVLAKVVFLNTGDHDSDAARQRDGDAVVLWLANDTDDDGASPADGVNVSLYAAYFDVSHARDAASNYGFQQLGTRISTLDAAGENISSVAIVTDGLCGENRFGGSDNGFRYGEETTGIVVAWVQAQDNDAANAAVEDTSLWYSWFNLAAAGEPDVPLVASVPVRIPLLGFGASDSGLDSEETQIDGYMIAYNNLLFIRVASGDSLSGEIAGTNSPTTALGTAYGVPMTSQNDVTLESIAFDLDGGTFAGPVSLAAAAKSSDILDSIASNMAFLVENNTGTYEPGDTPSVYGSDEGLAALEIFFVELASDPDAMADFGSVTVDSEVRVAQIDESTGVVGSFGVVSPGDPAISDNVRQGDVSTRISRNGDYIWAMWQQPFVAGASADRHLMATQLTTTRPEDDGTFVLPAVSSALSARSVLSADIDGSSVTWAAWQAALGYVCGVQSDPDVMSIAFQHSTAANDQVFIARLTADLDPTPTPTFAVALFETFPDAIPDLYTLNNEHVGFVFTDAGSGGDIVAAYVLDVDASAALDQRLFSRRNGTGAGVVEIDSTTSVKQVAFGRLEAVVTPPGSDIGRFDLASGNDSGDRPHPARYVHFIFREYNTTEDSGNGFALRTRRYNAGDPASTFAESFVPTAGTGFLPPFQLSLPFVDPSGASDAVIVGIGISGDSVGVWFQELGHAYYQEVREPGSGDDTGWRVDEGVTDPALVDDDSETELVALPKLHLKNCTCETLGGGILVWQKVFDVLRPNRRLQVRVRNNE